MVPKTIFGRLLLGNIIILLLVVVMGGTVVFKLGDLRDVSREILSVSGRGIGSVERFQESCYSLLKFGEKYVVSRDSDYLARFGELKGQVLEEFHDMELHHDGEEEKLLLAEIRNSLEIYLAAFEKTTSSGGSLAGPGHPEYRDRFLGYVPVRLSRIVEIDKLRISEKIEQTGLMSSRIQLVSIFATMASVVIGLFVSFMVTRSITGSLRGLKQKTLEIAEGRFEETGMNSGPLEIRDLARRFDNMCRRLGELDRLKADFVSHVSHELRTPVSAIREASVMLYEGQVEESRESREILYRLIHDECNRLLGSVRRVLDYSRLEAGKMDYRFAPLDMGGVLRRSILKLAPLSRKKNIDLELMPIPEDLPLVRADEDRILEVLDNLVGNSIKFTPESGSVVVEAGLCNIEDHVKVTVTDSGCGIRAEDLKAIFQKFKQIDHGEGTRMGSGLGLSISKYIIKAHGGNIWAESDLAKGTQISFILPVCSS